MYIIIAINRSILIGRWGDKARTSSRLFIAFASLYTEHTRIRRMGYTYTHTSYTLTQDARIHKNKSLNTARVRA